MAAVSAKEPCQNNQSDTSIPQRNLPTDNKPLSFASTLSHAAQHYSIVNNLYLYYNVLQEQWRSQQAVTNSSKGKMMNDLQKPKPKSRLRGCLRIIGWIFGIFILLTIIAVVVTPSTPKNTTSSQTQPVAEAATATPATITTDTQQKSEPLPTDTSAPPTNTPAPVDPNRGIKFGTPITFGSMGIQTAAVLVTNTTNQVKSFLVKATYKNGETIVATAIGAVNDLLPGQTRSASILSQDTIPDKFDSVRLDVDTMVNESDTTPGSIAASKLSFGKPAISGSGSFVTINVEVTNNDTAPHSLMVQAIALIDGNLVGVAIGAVNDIAPGQTKTASLLSQGKIEGTQIQVAAETVVQ